MLRICGIVFCYNEEQIIKETLIHYLTQGIDLVVFDNESTDNSLSIIQKIRSNPELYSGRINDVISISTSGYEWEKIIAQACMYMHDNLKYYEWIMLIDADAQYYSPIKNLSLVGFIQEINEYGYNLIDGNVFEKYPTEKDDSAIKSPVDRLQYGKFVDHGRQHKIFKYHPSITFFHGAHAVKRQAPYFAPIRFLYVHYPWVSYEHGLKKIFKERAPRYVERRINMQDHSQYYGLLPIKNDLVKNSSFLHYLNLKEQGVSLLRFKILVRLEIVRKMNILIRSFLDKLFRKIKGKFYFIQKLILKDQKMDQSLKAYSDKPPHRYHFLVNNFCNASCSFCNQELDQHNKNQLTLKNFKEMVAHIPLLKNQTFIFSGGGDPLLCYDLFNIIRFVNKSYPNVKVNVRTNGLLIQKLINNFKDVKIDQLEISVHGVDPEIYKDLMGVDGSKQLFQGLKVLKEDLKTRQSCLNMKFFVVLSKKNIYEIFSLIDKAKELNVSCVELVFMRYYSEEDSRGSLFFHQDIYDGYIKRANKYARKKGVVLTHEPLFSKKLKKKKCTQPWNSIVIDWDGTVYPCTGGEIWFKDKVKNKDYNFGNLQKEHLADWWNNVTYTKTRRSCMSFNKEDFIKECKHCHNSCCLEGSDVRHGHLLRKVALKQAVTIL